MKTSPTVFVPLSATVLDQLLRSRLSDDESLQAVIERKLKTESSDRRRRSSDAVQLWMRGEGPDTRRPSNGCYGYTVLGEDFPASTLADMLIGLLRTLCELDGSLLDRLSQVPAGRTRRIVARSPEAVYPGSPHLRRYTRQLMPGWWVGTNYSHRDIRRIAGIICNTCGLQYGKDVILQ